MHKVERIVKRIEEILKPLISNQTISKLAYTPIVHPSELPAVAIELVNEQNINSNLAFIDWDLTLSTTVILSATEENLLGQLLTIRNEIYKRLMFEDSLSLDFVLDFMPVSQSEPNYDVRSETVVCSSKMNWLIKYRAELTNKTHH